jgi:hypothetical protein
MALSTTPHEPYGSLDGEPLRQIKPGDYELRFDHYETAVMFGRAPKLVLWFTIISIGPYFDCVRLARFYNVRRLIGRPARYGGFKAGFHGEFIREYGRLFRVPTRLDRIPMTVFERHILIGRVRTVARGSNQREIPEGLRYSVVAELLRIHQ